MITTAEAQVGIKKLNAEIMSLNPGAIITFFVIDVSSIAEDMGVTDLDLDPPVFRFHNSISLFSSSLQWKNEVYVAAPIKAEGFDLNAKGTSATPTLSLSVSDQGVPLLAQLKQTLRKLGDLVGAKVTRKRTLVKYLDEANFYLEPVGRAEIDYGFAVSEGQDWSAQFPDDIYYIQRKSNENKYTIEYELGSVLEIDGIQLPVRLVSCQRCMWQYRGAGCLYEYKGNYANNPDIFEYCGENCFPDQAPPVANSVDSLITGLIGTETFTNKNLFSSNNFYSIGDATYISKNGINYYYVAKAECSGITPPNTNYWIEDQCSKTLQGCRLRWLTSVNTYLPFGGFPTVGKYGQNR